MNTSMKSTFSDYGNVCSVR